MEPLPEVRVLQPRAGTAVVECTGELDITNAHDLDRKLRELAVNELVVVDISKAEFIDSSIIHCLVRAHRRSRDQGTQLRLQLQAGSAPVVEVALKLSRVLELLDVANTRAEALAPRTGPQRDVVGIRRFRS